MDSTLHASARAVRDYGRSRVRRARPGPPEAVAERPTLAKLELTYPVVPVGAAARSGRWTVNRLRMYQQVRSFVIRTGGEVRVTLENGFAGRLTTRTHTPTSFMIRPNGAFLTDSNHPFSFGDAGAQPLAECWQALREGWTDERVRRWIDRVPRNRRIPQMDLVPYRDDEMAIVGPNEIVRKRPSTQVGRALEVLAEKSPPPPDDGVGDLDAARAHCPGPRAGTLSRVARGHGGRRDRTRGPRPRHGRMRLPDTAHTARPWRIHELTGDFRLEDVWQLPGTGGPDDFLRVVQRFASADPSQDSPGAVRVLFAIRWKLGELFGWDAPHTGVGSRVPTLRDRLPEDLRDAPSGPDFDALPFDSLYLTDDEWAAEIANRTMHGVLHIGRVPDGAGSFRAQLAVLVKPNGLLGNAYMAAIRPFRHLIVYPSMMRQIERESQMGD